MVSGSSILRLTALTCTANRRYDGVMCRSIQTLHNFEPPATSEEVRAAATQYVRKLSGSRSPSRANAEVFEQAITEVAAATERMLGRLVTTATPRNREVEAAKARERTALRR